ncbi:MAG: hypothetical protein R2724_29775 [Bryobacterales bacterium]
MTASGTPAFLAGTNEGLFVSHDEMRTWEPILLGEGVASGQPVIAQLERDPGNQGAFYAAGPAALYRSDDQGVTWSAKVAGLPEGAEFREIFVMRSRPGTLYVDVTFGDERSVYKSTDRAESWQQLRTIPPDADQMEIHVNNPDLWYYEGGRTIYRSQDEGATWALTGPFPIRRGSGNLQNGVTDIATNPDDQNILLIVTNGPVFGSTEYSNGFFFSDTQGATWERRTESGGQQIFVDGVTLVYHVEGGQLWVSLDGGRTVREPVDIKEGVGLADAFLVDRRNASLLYSGLYRSTDTGRTWTEREGSVTPLIGSDDGPVEITGSTNDVAPKVTQITIRALGDAAWKLDFTLETDVPWLTPSPADGTTSETIRLAANAGGLEPGVHQTALVVRSQQAFNPVAEIPVILTVTSEPAGEASPTIMTFAGTGDYGTDGDGGPAAEATLEKPTALAFDSSGALLIADRYADNVRRVTSAGVISTFAGNGMSGFSGDGGAAVAASFDSPESLAVQDGVVFIADRFNRRVRAVSRDGKVSTYFGTGEFGSVPSQGTLADLAGSFSTLLAHPDGSLFVSGSGTERVAADGTFLKWHYLSYRGLAVAPDGRVYGTRGNQVFQLGPSNFEKVIAGGSDAGFVGDGGPATDALLDSPSGLAIDGEGRIYVADTDNQVVRRIDVDGTITTYAGVGLDGYSGDGGPANRAQLSDPVGLAIGPDGELYIAEDRRVRLVLPPGSAPAGPMLTSAGVVSAASFTSSAVAPSQIVSIFGANLAPSVEVATTTPLPESLAGVRAEFVDSGGATHALQLFFVAPGQINALIPAGAAAGSARLRVIAPGGLTGETAIEVASVAPGLFSANASGAGVAAAAAVRVAQDGTQTPIDVLQGSSPVAGAPIDLGPEGEQVVLLLFGTGFRNFSGSVEVTIGGVAAQVLGIAPQPQFTGLDQLNVIVPRALIGAGEVEVRVTIDGVTANVVTIVIA